MSFGKQNTMVRKFTPTTFLVKTVIFFILQSSIAQETPAFSQSNLNFNGNGSVANGVTGMMYGPDGRLYIAEYLGLIKILTIQRNSSTDYEVTSIETLSDIQTMSDHNDDGSTFDIVQRETIGIVVDGTSTNPVFYVSSSDFRIGSGIGGGNGDVGLDTNSGVITRFSWTGSSWDVVDIVRGLPRSEENHASNGLELVTINGTDYLLIAQGGHTNGGGPSTNFVFTCEYALSAAVLSVDLDAINSLPVLSDNGRQYIYDLPTLDDPSRANVNGIIDPNAVGYDGVDVNDPWGGNDGLNQAIVDPSGPVQIFSPGYRNAYDLVVTQSGALYVTDNGANQGWGGFPVNEGGGTVTNDYDPNEPGSTSASGSEQINNLDHLQLVTNNLQTYVPGSYYGGHPNPTRANPTGAGLYTAPGLTGTAGANFRTQTYDPNGSTSGSTSDANIALPANWPPVQQSNPIEGDWRGPGIANPDGPINGQIAIWNTNTNGITEYKASNFGGVMQGNLLAGHSGGNVHRVELNADGTAENLSQNFFSGIGGYALGITSNGDTDNFPGTVWVGTLNGKIIVFEPQDFICINPAQPSYDANADYDSDGYTNQDEEDNGTDPCNGGSQPDDFDMAAGGTLISDLNDTDDDADGISDALDPFQLGNPTAGGSDAFTIPIINDFFNDQQGLGGIFGLGMTGLMNNGDVGSNWLDWLDVQGAGPNPDDVLGGAPGLMTSHMTSGTAFGNTNTQEKGYQYGVQTSTTTGTFTVSGKLVNLTGPLRLYGNTAAVGGELGYFIGDGTQSNYIKIVLTATGITALQEINDIPQTPINLSIDIADRPNSDMVLHFVVNPDNGQVDLEYVIDGGTRNSIGTITVQGSILNAIQQTNEDLAVGIIGTSNTLNVELEGTFDFLSVIQENLPNAEVAINAGGPEILENGTTYTADQDFTSGSPYINPSALVPELYKTERSSPTKAFQYSVPLDNGDYTIVLHFAEIYWGATGGGPGGNNLRVFDVSIEDDLVLDNYDIYSEVGAEVVQKKSFDVNVSDGFLTIDFSSLTGVGGIDQPKVSAIEIFSATNNQAPSALIEADLVAGQAPLNITFTGENSSDDKGIVNYLWDFGDGNTSTEQNPEYTFNAQGIYNVSLSVEDEEGESDTDTITVTVSGQNAEVIVSGELKKWHNIGILFTGPETSESDVVNPFLDYRLNVTFTSPVGKQFVIPGFYAADGNAAETSAASGDKWMVRFSPDEIGEWTYSASFRTGSEIAVSLVESEGTPTAFDGISGTLVIGNTDKVLPDNRSKGILDYVDERYLKFRETGKYFLKAGTDSPENFLAYSEFDNTLASKDWSPHIQDWTSGDPVWKTNNGMGVVGAINYLSNKGMNAFSFLTMNVNGDGKDVWPWSATNHSELDGNSQSEVENRLRYDVSKLEQWEKVFEHGDSQGMFLNFKTQETENDQLLDGGQLGVQRKLYYRELIARFGHHLALNWNLGEEYDLYNALSDPQNLILKEYIEYIDSLDAYDHPIVVHSYPFAQSTLYNTLLGPTNTFSGPSMQSFIDNIHDDVVKWVQDSDNAGKQWVVSNDEQGDPETGVSADADYTGDKGTKADNRNDVRHKALWGTLMGGGDGVEYYFGYSTGETDLSAEDFRSRAHKWEDAKLALDFFDQHIPYWGMHSNDQLISNSNGYCLAELDENYLIYLPSYEATTLDLSAANGSFSVRWFDPVNGGDFKNGDTDVVVGGSTVDIGSPPNGSNTDWVVLIEKMLVETIRINAGGPELTFEGEVFESDEHFVGGREFSNTDAQVPELYQTERSSLTNEFSYEIPVSNGNHIVKLHFADIYFGANGGGTGGVGSRVFDVFAEGGILLNDYDIIDDVGFETLVIKTFEVLVEDGSLSLAFDALGNDGIDQPKLSALEIIGPTEYPAVTVASIPDRSNLINETVDFGITATGGDPNVNFSYSISGQPVGIEIEPTNGLIYGTISPQATTGGTNNDGIHDVVVSIEKSGSALISTSFVWSIFDDNSQWVDKNENESYEAKGESGFVQAGDKFYVIGGLENQNVYAYDYGDDNWTDLGEAPLLFNHFQPVEYKGLIWVIGALKNRQYPTDTPSEYVWVFDPVENEWILGPEIPQDRVRGSAGLVLHNDKFYLVGGTTNGHNGGYVSWLDEFDPSTGEWRILPDAPRPRDHFYAVEANNKIYAIGGRWTGGTGGFFGPDLPEIDVFDLEDETWSSLPTEQNLPTPRAGAPVTFFQNQIMVMGGEILNAVVYGEELTEEALQITEGFNVANNTWSRLDDTAFPRHGTNAVVSGLGVYMASGAGGWGAAPPQNNMEYYGADSPEGEALVKSNIAVPSQILFSDNQPVQITVDITDGNTGLFLRSIQIIGENASDFEIVAGELENVLLSPNSQYALSLISNNQNSTSSAILRFNYGANSFVDVSLSNSILVNPGNQTSILGDNISLQIETNGSIAGFVFSANNLPEGLSIDETNGLVSGAILGAIVDSPYSSEVSLLNENTLAEIDKVIFSWEVIEVQTNGVVSFTLVDADTNQDILVLTEGMQLDASQYARRALSVRMETNPSVVGSVSAQLSGALTHVQTENFAPYAIFGDNGAGNYTARQFPLGDYFLSATAYTGSGLSGTAYPTATINFAIIETTLPTYDIVASSGLGGNILPSGTTTVNEGSNQQYVITADSGFSILDVQVDGESQGPLGSYSFTNVVANHSISATFESVASNGVVSFTLVDAVTNQDILVLTDGMQLDATQYAGRALSVRMETNPSVVGSVSAQLSGALTHVQTENFAPYAIFGDNGAGNYTARLFPIGDYTLSATAYTGSGLSGTAYPTAAIGFSIIETTLATYDIVASSGIGGSVSPLGIVTASEGASQQFVLTADSGNVISDVLVDGVSQGTIASYTFTNIVSNHTIEAVFEPSSAGVISFTLVDADTDQDLFDILSGDEIGLQTSNLSIRANTGQNSIGSVLMSLSGPISRTGTENFAPYALFGDNTSNYFGEAFPLGDYTISATAYSGSNLSGSNLGKLTVQFSIVNSAKDGSFFTNSDVDVFTVSNSSETEFIKIIPNPSKTKVQLVFSNPLMEIFEISLYEISGKKVQTYRNTEIIGIRQGVEFSIRGYENGVYLLQVIRKDETAHLMKLIIQN